MNNFLKRLMGVKSCTEIFTGACTEYLPLDTSNHEDMARWRLQQYEERCKAHALQVCNVSDPLVAKPLELLDAELMARQIEGLKIRAKCKQLWKRAMKKRVPKKRSISISKTPANAVVCLQSQRDIRRAS
jgi:hypothetical protein